MSFAMSYKAELKLTPPGSRKSQAVQSEFYAQQVVESATRMLSANWKLVKMVNKDMQ